MYDLFEGCGLIYQLTKFIDESLGFFSEKLKARSDFLEIREQKWDKAFHSFEWINYFEKHEIEPLTEEVKANIRELFERLAQPIESTLEPSGFIKGIDEYLVWMLNFDVILSYYLYKVDSNAYNTETWQKIKQYYDFLRSEVEKRHSLIPEPFNTEPLERFWQNQKKQHKPKVKCKWCKSEDTKKWSKFRYMCNTCGRTFTLKK